MFFFSGCLMRRLIMPFRRSMAQAGRHGPWYDISFIFDIIEAMPCLIVGHEALGIHFPSF